MTAPGRSRFPVAARLHCGPVSRLFSSAFCALAVASLPGCLAPADLSPQGFACTDDAACGEGGAFRCVESHCTPARVQLTLPLRGAFFSGGFPYSWSGLPAGHPEPLIGRYTSRDPAVVSGQLAAMHRANIQVALFTWWGPGTDSDGVFDALFQASRADSMQWAVVYQREAQDHPSATDIRLRLSDLYTRYAQAPNYAWLGDRYLVVIPTAYHGTCEVAERWVAGRDQSRTPAFLLMEVPVTWPTGDEEGCAVQPDAWYRIPQTTSVLQTKDATVVMPGIWKAGDAAPKVPRDPTRFRADVQTLVTSPQPFQLVDSFNDWLEGSAVEASAADAEPTAYLDALHDAPVTAGP